MASSIYLVSAVVTLLIASVVFVATARGREWHDYTPRIGPPRPSNLSRFAGDVRVWVLAFAVLVLATAAGVVSALQGGSTAIVFAVLAIAVVGLVTIGTYAMGRSRGHHHAYAVGEAAVSLGAIFLLAIVGYLVTSFGA